MFKHSRLLFVVIGATVTLGALVGTASANRLSTTSRNIRATWAQLVSEGAFEQNLSCPVTLEGSLHSNVITKSAGALIGFISRSTVNAGACSGAAMTVLQASLPWHIRYASFTGTLPAITKVNVQVIGMSFRLLSGAGASCLFVTSTTQPATLGFNRAAGGALTSADFGGSITSTTGCLFGFRTTATLTGRSTTLTQLGLATGITVTLI